MAQIVDVWVASRCCPHLLAARSAPVRADGSSRGPGLVWGAWASLDLGRGAATGPGGVRRATRRSSSRSLIAAFTPVVGWAGAAAFGSLTVERRVHRPDLLALALVHGARLLALGFAALAALLPVSHFAGAGIRGALRAPASTVLPLALRAAAAGAAGAFSPPAAPAAGLGYWWMRGGPPGKRENPDARVELVAVIPLEHFSGYRDSFLSAALLRILPRQLNRHSMPTRGSGRGGDRMAKDSDYPFHPPSHPTPSHRGSVAGTGFRLLRSRRVGRGDLLTG